MASLETTLAKIDQNLDAAVARLLQFVAIPSISTDPAFKPPTASAPPAGRRTS